MSSDVPSSVIERAKGNEIRITVRIGHEGVSESLISEISSQLAKRGMVKIKVNKGVLSNVTERTDFFFKLANKTDSEVVFQRGNVFVLWSG
tara:strand:+ start:481 stop:753 length:273 start_codon:yes stop_codon:yes gene_type:complete